MDKHFLVEQLTERLRATARQARRAEAAAAQEAQDGATESEKKEDGRVMLEQSGLARAQALRADRFREELAALEAFHPAPLKDDSPVTLGAVVEVEDEDGGRTFFLAPAGAGEELTAPGGDGFLSVVTPSSPVGRAVLGRCLGDTVEVTVQGQQRDWRITYVA